jgi:hypothetical protein
MKSVLAVIGLAVALSASASVVTVDLTAPGTVDQTWVNSGLTVTAGQTLTFTASGLWTIDNKDDPAAYGLTTFWSGPDGLYTPWGFDTYLSSGLQGALIAYVGKQPALPGTFGYGNAVLSGTYDYYLIGSLATVSFASGGPLWLGINDAAGSGGWLDNAGTMTVTVAPGTATTLTFDDLPINQRVPNGYGGLNWGSFWVFPQASEEYLGLHNGVVSGSQLAALGGVEEISAPSTTTFTLNSAYLTACWWSDAEVEVAGYLKGNLMFDRAFNLTPTTPLLADFEAAVVDYVRFTVSDSTSGFNQCVMDNLIINAPTDTAPWKGKSSGKLKTVQAGGGSAYLFSETGTATCVGKFTEIGTPDASTGTTWITITAANKDKLYGVVVGSSGSLPVLNYKIVIYGGTGQFKGARGSFVETLTIDPKTGAFTATSAGTISD